MLFSVTIGVLFGLLLTAYIALFQIMSTSDFFKCGIFLTIPVIASWSIPVISKVTTGQNIEVNPSFLYLAFMISTVLGIISLYLSIYRFNKIRFPLTTLDFVDYVKLNHADFKGQLKNEKPMIMDLILSVNEKTPGYVDEIYALLSSYDEEDDLRGEDVLIYALFTFNDMFLDNDRCRFTIRELDESNLTMRTIKTTRDDTPPGDIDLRKKNSIAKSMIQKRPVLYSRNKGHHFKTANNSLKSGVYDDYASYCLMTKEINGQLYPLYSVCIDVKGQDLSEKLSIIIDQPVFRIMCERISEKLNAEQFLNTEEILNAR